jgi:antitoxin component YwqK of YwqJK toxin-antitoxin module
MNKFNEKGQRHGYWEHYYFGGHLWYRINYINDVPAGLCELFDIFGTLKYKTFFL